MASLASLALAAIGNVTTDRNNPPVVMQPKVAKGSNATHTVVGFSVTTLLV
jgi:hypothetical protein